MQRTECAGGIVINTLGEIALVRNGPLFWGFPKGHIDVGEDAQTAAIREIAEETGLINMTPIKSLGSYGRYKGTPTGEDDTSEYKTIHMFLFNTDQKVLAPTDPSNPEARWIPHTEVATMLTSPKDKEFFESVLLHLTMERTERS